MGRSRSGGVKESCMLPPRQLLRSVDQQSATSDLNTVIELSQFKKARESSPAVVSASTPELDLSSSSDTEQEIMFTSSSEEGTSTTADYSTSAYATFFVSSDDEEQGPTHANLDQVFTTPREEIQKEQNTLTISRTLQGLPEKHLLQVLEELQDKFGATFIPYLSERIEYLRNNMNSMQNEDERWDWNARFQNSVLKAQLQFRDAMDDSDQMVLWSFLAKTAGDFVQIATVYGKIIISEVYIPITEKTIKPMHMGGTIGGDKYLVKKILFKFPKEEAGFYDEAAAAKIAGHELKGLSHLFNCGIVGLHFPMIALIDYLGFRLIAMTHLPLDQDSLVYGSNDGGQTIRSDSVEIIEKLQQCSTMLNLKPHMVGRDERVMVYSPADLEGHMGTDSNLYLLDFSRVFPPEPPQRDIKGSHLFRLLRPELVRSNPVPLCSDAFSGFITDVTEATEHNKEITDASIRLFREIIPTVSQQLNQLSKNALRQFLGPNNLLIEIIHANGINIRFIGVLRKYLLNESLRAQILVELLSRTLKTLMRAALRKAMKDSQLPLEHTYKRCVISLLNHAFGIANESYWRKTLLPAAKEKFDDFLSPQEQVANFSLKVYIKQHIGFSNFFLRFLAVTGLVFNRQTLLDFQANESLFDFVHPFDVPDLEELGAQVHHMNIVDNAMGFVLKCRARMKEGGNPDRLCRIALRNFDKALYSNPQHPFALRNYASTLAVMGKYRQAAEYYRYALTVEETNISTLFEYSCFLIDVGSYREAATTFEKIIALQPPELFGLYRQFDQKLLALPHTNHVIQEIQYKFSHDYFPTKSEMNRLKNRKVSVFDSQPKIERAEKSKRKKRPHFHGLSKTLFHQE